MHWCAAWTSHSLLQPTGHQVSTVVRQPGMRFGQPLSGMLMTMLQQGLTRAMFRALLRHQPNHQNAACARSVASAERAWSRNASRFWGDGSRSRSWAGKAGRRRHGNYSPSFNAARRPAREVPSCSLTSPVVAGTRIASRETLNIPKTLNTAGEATLCQAASERLWKTFLAPVVFYPLAAGDMLAGGPEGPATEGVRRVSVGNWARTWLPPGAPPECRNHKPLLVLLCLAFPSCFGRSSILCWKGTLRTEAHTQLCSADDPTSRRPFQTPATPARPTAHSHTLQSVDPDGVVSCRPCSGNRTHGSVVVARRSGG